jgi:hypothetical protein
MTPVRSGVLQPASVTPAASRVAQKRAGIIPQSRDYRGITLSIRWRPSIFHRCALCLSVRKLFCMARISICDCSAAA